MTSASRSALLAAMLAVGVAACRSAGAPVRGSRTVSTASAVPAMLLGAFTDDYGTHYQITAESFNEGASAYRVVAWHADSLYLLAQNADSTPGGGARWSRFDWVLLPDQGAYTWGYCHSAWRAPTLDSARATQVVNRSVPRTGCNGHPFTRMQRVGIN